MKAVLVTGSNGGIGTALCSLLRNKGYFVIGSDINEDKNELSAFLKTDIQVLAESEQARRQFKNNLLQIKGRYKLHGLINNAAVQILSSMENIKIEDFKKTLDVNLVAPLALSKIVYEELKCNKGSIVNIGSIHSKLTKPKFISYATSKSALLGLTQAMAVDCGEYVRVNAVQPAATSTEMLLDGFRENPEAFKELLKYHPTNSIASPNEVAEVVAFLLSEQCPFINGTVLDINGGIGSRLHDPA